ncbi:MAG TPA: Gldg family protein [Vicinamibacterales bacterium]|nr:Gldg family protein [Vicinamibacterales bacterium]HOQ59133.1 Gldg family protein [Vicinamibacterales bacterium]HPK70669.1 Gldg family protein [Vicinamibacterales bacterium]
MRKLAFLPGALMVAAGVVWAALALRWTTPAAVLAAGGAAALAVGVAASWRDVREWLGDPRGVFALNAALSTLLLAAVLVLVNALAARRAPAFDWTEAGRHTLAAETVRILEDLGEDVVFTQWGRTRDPGVGRLLESFASRSPRLAVRFADLDASPQAAREHGVTRAGTVVVSSPRRFRKVERVTEPALATAILQVTSPAEPAVCFASGDGEHGLEDTGPQGLSTLASVLAASNFAPRRVSLLEGDAAQGCAALVVPGVPRAFPAGALERVSAHLARGGRVLLALDPPVDPGVAGFLRRLGIVAGQGVIIETSGAGRAVGAGPENPVSFAYHDHPVTRGLDQRAIFGRAAPLAVAPTEIGRPIALVSTADSAFERADLESQFTGFQAGRDRRGPFALAVATSIGRGARDAALPEPRLVVTGDSDFLANGLIGWSANRELAVRIVSWLAGVDEARIVSVEERQNRRVALTERRRAWMYIVNLGVLPLLPLAARLLHLLRTRSRA